MPKNTNTKWTPEDDARLKLLIEANMSCHLIAAKLKRSVTGVKGRLSVLGISNKRVWVGLRAKSTKA
jgi:hypothetical protein